MSQNFVNQSVYGNKIAYANSADPNQTAPEGAVWSGSTLLAIPLSILRSNSIKSKIYAKEDWNKVLEILGHLPYPKIQTEEENWSGSALFVIQYVNLYQHSGSSNLIGLKLEVGVASKFIQHDKG